MSRIGRKITTIPSGVQVTADAKVLTVKGPKGQLTVDIHPAVVVSVEGNEARVSVREEQNVEQRALWGLFGALLRNMVKGVTEGFTKQLEARGVGYKVRVEGKNLILDVGYSHEVVFPIPENITITVEKTFITVSGIDKQLVGFVASQIRKIRKPEPYKGKGIRYTDEQVMMKAGKAAKAGGK